MDMGERISRPILTPFLDSHSDLDLEGVGQVQDSALASSSTAVAGVRKNKRPMGVADRRRSAVAATLKGGSSSGVAKVHSHSPVSGSDLGHKVLLLFTVVSSLPPNLVGVPHSTVPAVLSGLSSRAPIG